MRYCELKERSKNKTMKSGNIFIDKEGTDIGKIVVEKRNQVLHDYYIMRANAKENEDKFFYINSQEWEDFLSNIWSPDNKYWEGVDMNYITALQVDAFPQRLIDDISMFNALSAPKCHGGYGYDGHPTTDYVHNSKTWENWHNKFYYEHPEEINWAETNGIMPCHEKIIDILRKELLDLQSTLNSKGNNNLCNLSKEQILNIKATKWEEVSSEKIVSDHNDIIIRHKGNQIKAYSESIGSRICLANYYHNEVELEKLEKNHGNKKVSKIYSIKKDNKYQFISIDTAHGKFELCDDSGSHLREIRFDGSPNGTATTQSDHSLHCIAEWKKTYNK